MTSGKRTLDVASVSIEGVSLQGLCLSACSYGVIDEATTVVRFLVPSDAKWVLFASDKDFCVTHGTGTIMPALPLGVATTIPFQNGGDQQLEVNPGLRKLPDPAEGNSIFVQGLPPNGTASGANTGVISLTWYT